MWIASTVSTAGDSLATVALSLLVYDRTKSPAWTAAVYAMTMLPTLVSGPMLAWLADRFPRRAVMVICAWLQAALVALMAIPQVPLAVMIVLLVLVQMIASPFLAAQEATLPSALPKERYNDGVALFGSSVDVAQMVGLAGAGFIVAAMGPQAALAVDAATFVLVAILIQFSVVHRPAADPLARAPRRKGIGVGDEPKPKRNTLNLIFSTPTLRSVLGLRLLAGFAMVPAGLAVPLAVELGAPWSAGLILALEPATNVVGVALLYRFVRDDRARDRLIGPLAILSLVPLIGFASDPNLVWTVALLTIAGLAGAFHTPARAAWGRTMPDAYRGRAHGIARTALRASQGGGMAIGGTVAQAVGSITLTIAGAGAVGALLAIRAASSWSRANNEVSADVTL
ncbi:MFS transporter [Lentzea tibetensis]|uniref:MFS transporter n=2 Tax=Lentzea tibetensis TaxID=2591470 RepID=A0A563EUL2_9PSEU|nr:MFS transporter [Lentzea tibetensis]